MKVRDSLSLEGDWFNLFDDVKRFPHQKVKIRPLYHTLVYIFRDRYKQAKEFARNAGDEKLFCADQAEMVDYFIEDFEGFGNEATGESLPKDFLSKLSIMQWTPDGKNLREWIIRKAYEIAEERIREALDFND